VERWVIKVREVDVMGKRGRWVGLAGMFIEYLNRVELCDGNWGRWAKGLSVWLVEEWDEVLLEEKGEGMECEEKQVGR
jgi:hypothetical protein